jgi:hypothetical protein
MAIYKKEGILVFKRKYIISDYFYEGVNYKATSYEEIERYYKQWQETLSSQEMKAFEHYRKKINTNNNINARASCPDNILVYRCLSRKENKDMSNKIVGQLFMRKDYKGTHVKDIVTGGFPIINSAGYMIILMPKGAKAAYINNLSNKFKNEREMLIDKGQVFMLIEKNNDIFNLPTYIVKLQINRSI